MKRCGFRDNIPYMDWTPVCFLPWLLMEELTAMY